MMYGYDEETCKYLSVLITEAHDHYGSDNAKRSGTLVKTGFRCQEDCRIRFVLEVKCRIFDVVVLDMRCHDLVRDRARLLK